MRHILLVLIGAAALGTTGSAPAEAVGTRYPFCIQGDEFPGLSNCTFTSYQQCQATASGRLLYCIENPYYQPDGEYQTRQSPRQRRGQNYRY